jgi:histidinol-phosphatase
MGPTSESSVRSDLDLAIELADAADRITLAHYRSVDLVVEAKPDLTPVTDADRGVELALRQMIAGARPEDSVVGEEYGSSGALDDDGRRWVIDPIDGTKNYVRGIPPWATLIALESGGRTIVGVASAPALGRRWWASRGAGAWVSVFAGTAERMHVSAVSRLADAQLSYGSLGHWLARGDGSHPVLALAARCWRTRAFGDFWSHVLVAEGACDIGLDPIVSVWDLAALQVIVEEAGGRFTDLAGRAWVEGGSAVSTNGMLHDEVLEILGMAP